MSSGAISVGVRLHDLPQGSVEERIRMASELGFECIQLPSKVLYKDKGITFRGLTQELAASLRAVLDETGVHVAVFGCYKNLAEPDPVKLRENLDEYAACLRFAQWLGGCPVGTETGRPNTENAVRDDRFTNEALDVFCCNLQEVVRYAEVEGGKLLIEPGWNEVVCTPERCRMVLDRVASPALGVIYDPVSLLHPKVVRQARAIAARMLLLCGSKVQVLHAKDYEVVHNEDAAGWCDGSGSRLVCHGVATKGNYDFSQLVDWAAMAHPGIDCVVENGEPSSFAVSLAALHRMAASAGSEHPGL